ncbi:MAG: hypothetical protein RIS36_2069 [Pseudomonadota bacterium]|jgi:hypothetical protein
MIKFWLGFLVGILGVLVIQERAEAADVKIVDSAGLIRGVRVVRDSSRVTVSLTDPKGARGECVATNVDGIASERRETISSKGECVFNGLPAGTWQVTVAGGARWRVRIDE